MIRRIVTTLFVAAFPLVLAADEWKPAAGRLMTRWANDVSPQKVHPEYPRPQMVREKWVNLNGLWDYAITDGKLISYRDATERGKILVPFPVESALSGVMKRVPDNGRLLYRRTFATPEMPEDGRLLLHFGAVDWETVVSVNGKKVGEHRGGYDPFTFDVTEALKPASRTATRTRAASDADAENELVVAVNDPTDGSFQPRGKQVRNPHGIWYTPTTGIWQTVWLEPVPDSYIARLSITPELDAMRVCVAVQLVGPRKGLSLDAWVSAGGDISTGTIIEPSDPNASIDEVAKLDVQLPIVRPWSPADPFLYDLSVELKRGDKIIDSVRSYFGLRKIALGKDDSGVTRILLNGKPLFQYGLLDQGFWPDGLYTAPTDAALRYDIEVAKQLGFNMIRKHVKVEPDRWYYHCDKLGMLVWQDMPSGDKHAAWDPFGRHDNTEAARSPESSENFNREWKAIIDSLRNHPSIVMWVPFNEGWGQANTVAVTKWTKQYDPTRLVNCASGGNDFPVGDVIDVHRYPGPFAPKPTGDRAAVLGEFGGLGLPLKGHTWQDEKNWGYRSFTTPEALTDAYLELVTRLRPLVASPGCSAAVYTQTTDVEIEVNGLMTYDRAVIKMPPDRVAAANKKLYLPPPKVELRVPTSQLQGLAWRYTTDAPVDGWFRPDFDDAAWNLGPGGFGTKGTPGTVVRTEWKANDIWIRRTFELIDGTFTEPHLLLHHDEDAEVYINGVLAKSVNGYTVDYAHYSISPEARETFKPGRNTLAVHCKQTGGGQYIDVGLIDIIEAESKPK